MEVLPVVPDEVAESGDRLLPETPLLPSAWDREDIRDVAEGPAAPVRGDLRGLSIE